MSNEHRDKIRLSNTKLDCDCKTEKHYRIRKTKPYYAWVKRVVNRDKICVMCETEGRKLHAHHIVSLKENIELALVDDNGAALCNRCHAIIHNFGNYTSKKTTLESDSKTYEELINERSSTAQ